MDSSEKTIVRFLNPVTISFLKKVSEALLKTHYNLNRNKRIKIMIIHVALFLASAGPVILIVSRIIK